MRVKKGTDDGQELNEKKKTARSKFCYIYRSIYLDLITYLLRKINQMEWLKFQSSRATEMEYEWVRTTTAKENEVANSTILTRCQFAWLISDREKLWFITILSHENLVTFRSFNARSRSFSFVSLAYGSANRIPLIVLLWSEYKYFKWTLIGVQLILVN